MNKARCVVRGGEGVRRNVFLRGNPFVDTGL